MGHELRALLRAARGAAWESLPTSLHIGAILDEVQFARHVAGDLRLPAGLHVLMSN